MRKQIFAAAACAVLAAMGIAARGMFINNTVKIPVDRVTVNVEAWIKEKPKDAQAYYVLGRIHAMAWAYGPDLSLWKAQGADKPDDPFGGQLPGFAPYDSVEVRRDEKKQNVTADDAKHLEGSIANYQKAAELDPKNAIYELGLAWILQEAGKVAANLPEGFGETTAAKPTDAEKAAYEAAIKKLGNDDAKVRDEASKALSDALPKSYVQIKAIKTTDPEVTARQAALLATYWELAALDHYRKAYSLRIDEDLKRNGGMRAGDNALAQEAGDGIIAILARHPEADKANELRDVTANVKTLKAKPQMVTPVIFAMPATAGIGPAKNSSMTPAANVGDLIDSAKRVTFDLAGDNVDRQWPWLKDGAALLVWDPAHTGTITNGRQLFGSRTWWIFFRDGYEALRTLDDNRDGQLTGAELEGIAVWIDKNGNGISEPGEVLTLQQAGITAIGVRDVEGPDGVLTSDAGITFTDGRIAKTFDWVTSPVTESTQRQPHN